MVKCVWEHVRKVCEYHKDTKERLSWIRSQRFALHSWYTSLFRIFILAAYMFNFLVSPTAAITSLLHPVIELWFYFFMIMFGVGFFIYGYHHIRKYIFASMYSLMLALWLLSWRTIPFLLILLIHPFHHSAINNGLHHRTAPPDILPPLPNSYLLPLLSIGSTILPALLVYPITSSLSSQLQLSDHFFVAFIILHSTVSGRLNLSRFFSSSLSLSLCPSLFISPSPLSLNILPPPLSPPLLHILINFYIISIGTSIFWSVQVDDDWLL